MREDRRLTSPKQGRRYRIKEVAARRITVERLDADESATLTAGDVTRAIHFLNAAGGRVGRRTLLYTVAEEVALVELHPRLDWDAEKDWIEVVAGNGKETARPVYLDFDEAPNDDPAELALFARRVRAGQPRFRRNLLVAYGERCAISGWGPADVLEAAHILLHAHTGLNETNNGLLLRSDLHILFDDGLLRIDPDSLRVSLDPSLADTPYWDWNGASLRPRVDGSHPHREYLRARWAGEKEQPVPRNHAVPASRNG